MHDLSSGRITNIGAPEVKIIDDWLVYSVWETFRSEDLNGDGDTGDLVYHVQDLASGETLNLELAGRTRNDTFLS